MARCISSLSLRFMKERVRVVEIERHEDLKLVLGGLHGYQRVRGGVGPNKNQYQGYTKGKEHTTKLYIAVHPDITGIGNAFGVEPWL